MARRQNRPSSPPPGGPGLFDTPPEEPSKKESPGKASGPDPAPTPIPIPEPEPEPEPEPKPEPEQARRTTVSELTRDIGDRLGSMGRVSVEGELSGLKRFASGHVYFDLKDENARLAGVIWRSRVSKALRFEAEDGMQVVAHGKLDVYAPRGSYSLIVERLEPLGVGALLAQLEELKQELAGLGWFDRRRPLPQRPRCIGVVTSRDGAALRDFLRTRSLRWPLYPVRLCHTPVQGAGAAQEIADAIGRLDRSGVDVIVLCRGGGSLEDLWAFNERPVAEAIHAASVPVVTGVGHETDTTLADLVSDHRAHTPTDAATAVIPDRALLQEELARLGNYLLEAMDRVVLSRSDRLRALAERGVLRRSDWILGRRGDALRAARSRLQGSVEARLMRESAVIQRAQLRLERLSPASRVERWSTRLMRAGERLVTSGARCLEAGEHRLGLVAGALQRISPLAVLERGYSLTTPVGSVQPLLDAESLEPGDRVETRLSRGSFVSSVLEVTPEEGGGQDEPA